MLNQPEISFGVIGLLMFLAGYLLWRSAAVRQRISRTDPLKEAQRELETRRKSPQSLVNEMEVRLYDYGREVEGRVESTINVLDRLIIDAEREIGRLESLLNQSRDTASETVLLEESPMLARIPQLIQAGLTDEEIARCLNCDNKIVAEHRTRTQNKEKRSAA